MQRVGSHVHRSHECCEKDDRRCSRPVPETRKKKSLNIESLHSDSAAEQYCSGKEEENEEEEGETEEQEQEEEEEEEGEEGEEEEAEEEKEGGGE